MTALKASFVYASVTLALAMPVAASSWLNAKLAGVGAQLAAHPIKMPPDEIGQWHRATYQDGIVQPDCLALKYVSNDQRKFFLVIRRDAIFRNLHDVYDCLIARAASPAVLGRVTINDGQSPVRASLVLSQLPTRAFLSLLWFQNSTTTAADRWSWRWQLLRSGLQAEPIYHEIEILIPRTANQGTDLATLRELALEVHHLQL